MNRRGSTVGRSIFVRLCNFYCFVAPVGSVGGSLSLANPDSHAT